MSNRLGIEVVRAAAAEEEEPSSEDSRGMGMQPPDSELRLLLESWKPTKKLATCLRQTEDLSRSSHFPVRLESSMMSAQAKAVRGAYVAEVEEGHSLGKEDIHKVAWGGNLVEEADTGTSNLWGKPRPEGEDPPSRPE